MDRTYDGPFKRPYMLYWYNKHKKICMAPHKSPNILMGFVTVSTRKVGGARWIPQCGREQTMRRGAPKSGRVNKLLGQVTIGINKQGVGNSSGAHLLEEGHLGRLICCHPRAYKTITGRKRNGGNMARLGESFQLLKDS